MVFPKSKFIKLVLPISYLIFLQLLTGIPKPHTLKNFNAGILIEEFSSEIFSYPFWIQDLSHLPLFFLLAWLSQLFFQKKKYFFTREKKIIFGMKKKWFLFVSRQIKQQWTKVCFFPFCFASSLLVIFRLWRKNLMTMSWILTLKTWKVRSI